MENTFVIMCRYESFTVNGKQFNNWFVYDSTPRTEKEGKEKIKKIKEELSYIDVKTKLKHEYKLSPYSEYENELKAIYDNIKQLQEKRNAYLKSDEYKELKRKKQEARKELKARQQKYIEEHKNES